MAKFIKAVHVMEDSNTTFSDGSTYYDMEQVFVNVDCIERHSCASTYFINGKQGEQIWLSGYKPAEDLTTDEFYIFDFPYQYETLGE